MPALPASVHYGIGSKDDPSEVVMARAAGRTSLGSGGGGNRTRERFRPTVGIEA